MLHVIQEYYIFAYKKVVFPVSVSIKRISLFVALLLMPFAAWPVHTDMRVEVYTTQDGLSHRIIFDMEQDEDGFLWIATWNGLCRYDGKAFDTFNLLDNGNVIGRLHRVRLAVDSRYLACLGDNGETYLFDRCRHHFLPDTVGVPLKPRRHNPYRLHVEGNDLVISADKWQIPRRLTVNENKSFERTLLASYTDRQGNLWVAFNDALYKITFASGLFTYHRRVSDDRYAPFYGDEIRAFCLLADGSRWVATKNGIVCVYDSSDRLLGSLSPQGKVVTQLEPFACSVYAIKQAPSGRVWIASKGDGLFCCDIVGEKSYKVMHYCTADHSLINDMVYDLCSDGNGRLWVATFGGINIFDERAGTVQQELLSGKKIRYVGVLDSCIVATGTEGLYIFDMRGRLLWQQEGHDFSFVCSTSQATYVSTMGAGLFKLVSTPQGYELSSVSLDGVRCNVILSLAADEKDQLWLVCDNKLVRYDSDGDIQQFDQSYFHHNMTFSEAHPCRVDSLLRIGYAEGWLEINKHYDNDYIPPLYWKSVQVGDSIYTMCDTLLQVPYDTDVTIEPVAIDFRYPASIRYAYRLDGESRWQLLPADRRYIRLSGLSPGKHRVEVRSTDCYGIWTTNAKTIVIDVEQSSFPTIYWIAAVLLLVLLALVFHLYRRNRQRASREAEALDIMPASPEIMPEKERFLQAAVACVEEHMADPDFTVDELADALHVGRTVFYKRIKDYLDITPLAFIKGIRIKRAKQLLLLRQHTVAEVAYMTGFSDAKYFGKVFKKETGLSPMEFVEQNIEGAKKTPLQ